MLPFKALTELLGRAIQPIKAFWESYAKRFLSYVPRWHTTQEFDGSIQAHAVIYFSSVMYTTHLLTLGLSIITNVQVGGITWHKKR